MSIFKTENCPICGTPTNAFEKTSAKYNGLFICRSCCTKMINSGINVLKIKNISLEELKGIVGITNQSYEERQKEKRDFKITKQVGNYLYLDDNQKKFALPTVTLSGKLKDMRIYNYADIIDYELIEDGNSISKGGVGRAFVGGALFGGIGAIVGSNTGHKQKGTCTRLQIKITLNDISCPAVYINLIEAETKKDGMIYKAILPQAQEILSLLNIICQNNSQESNNSNTNSSISVPEEIKKYKELLDIGAITQEEFETKKKQLLGV